jgi:tetratricopeptide (TPR) repeat protein
LAQIAQAIAHHLDFLADDMRDRPERHRSMRAVFDHTWQLLAGPERDAFRHLSVFRGTFAREEALRVTAAPAPTLAALVDKSLLQRLPSGRYQVHDLLRQYAAEKLQQVPGEQARLRQQHSHAYAALARQFHPGSARVAHDRIVTTMAANLPNLLAAWKWGVARRDAVVLDSMCRPLADYYQLTSAFREGARLFGAALDELGWPGDGSGPADSLRLFRWYLLSVQAMFAVYLGNLGQARANLERCLPFFRRNGVLERVAHCQFFLGEIARFGGDLSSASQWYEESLGNYQALDDRPSAGFCLNGLGLVADARGQTQLARAHLSASLEAFRQTGHDMGQAIASTNLAKLLLGLGDYDAARATLDESMAICRRLGHRWALATCLRYRGDIARLEGNVQEARSRYLESLRLLEDIGQRQAAAASSIQVAGACTALGQYDEARQYLRQALATAAELGDTNQMAGVAVSLAALLASEGQGQTALQLAHLVEDSPSVPARVAERASQVAAQVLESGLEPPNTSRQNDGDGTLESLLTRLLLVPPA